MEHPRIVYKLGFKEKELARFALVCSFIGFKAATTTKVILRPLARFVILCISVVDIYFFRALTRSHFSETAST